MKLSPLLLVAAACTGSTSATVASQTPTPTVAPTAPTATPTVAPSPTPVPTATPRPSTPEQIIAAATRALDKYGQITETIKSQQTGEVESQYIQARYLGGQYFGSDWKAPTYDGPWKLKPDEKCGSSTCWVLYAEWTRPDGYYTYRLSVYVDQGSLLVLRHHMVWVGQPFGEAAVDTDYVYQ